MKFLSSILLILAMLATACTADQAATDIVDNGEATAVPGDDPDTTEPDPTDPETTEPAEPGDSSDPDNSGQTDPPLRRGRLQAFDACDAYLAHMKTVAGERVTAWGLDGGGYFGGPVTLEQFDDVMLDDFGGDFAMTTEAASDSAAAPTERAAETTSADSFGGDNTAGFSETNNQVAGVDEPDIVKTDGNRIVTVTGMTLQIFDLDGSNANPTAQLELPSYPRDMLLEGDRVVVLAEEWGPVVAEPFDAEASFASEPYNPVGGPVTAVTQIDISNGQAEEISTLRVEGSYVSARRIGTTVRLVVSSPPPTLSFIYPSGPGSEDVAEETNRKIIEDSQLSDWLSEYAVIRDGEEIESGPVSPCNRIYRPSEFSGFGVLSVLTVDMAADQLSAGNGTAVVTDGQSIYASDQSLYVTTTVAPTFTPGESFEFDEGFEEDFTTAVHRFDISDPTVANYVASGEAKGTMLNQFSMHEWDNRLFVATTEGSPWGFSENSVSGITVLEPQGADLVEVGAVSDMGRGERIFSARFVEDTAYVVTFRQVDPLYVVDLSDATNPRVTGELKIPGFSTYLHPIGNGRLIGIGQDATDQGRTTGLKVSLFDVSDPTDPQEQTVWTLPNGYSMAENDHKAFLWWAERDLAVLPAVAWGDQFSGAVLLRVTTDGIEELGRIDHRADETTEVLSTCEVIEIGVDYFGPGAEGSICRPGDVTPQSPDSYCDVVSSEDFSQGWSEELGLRDLDLGPDGEFWFCFPENGGMAPDIYRSIIIGDSLWTLSYQHLQSNQLDTFERTDRETLAGQY